MLKWTVLSQAIMFQKESFQSQSLRREHKTLKGIKILREAFWQKEVKGALIIHVLTAQQSAAPEGCKTVGWKDCAPS